MKTYNLLLIFFLSAATHQALSKKTISRPRFVGGYACNIQPNKAPFAISIYSNLMCGGALVTQEWILTAAHCLTKEATSKVSVIARAGFNSPTNLVQERRVGQFRVHEKYNASAIRYDIALAGVNRRFDLSPVAQLARLPEVGFASTCQSALAVGIGLTRPNEVIILERRVELYERSLMCVDLPLIHNVKICQNAYRNVEIDDGSLFCASGTGKDTCTGDSGGPLVCNGRVIGIVAYGPSDCGSPKATTIYTKVESYLGFIRKYVKTKENVPRKLPIVKNCSRHIFCRWKLVFVLAFTLTLTNILSFA